MHPPLSGASSGTATPGIRPDDAFIAFAYSVLRREAAALAAARPRVESSPTPDEIHELRVAARRLRVALRLFGRMLPTRARARFSTDLRWFAGSLGDGFRYQVACARGSYELTEFNEVLFVPPTFAPVLFDRSGNDPAFAPEDLWNFWLAKTWSNGFGVGAGGRLVGEQYIAEDNVYQAEDSLTFDATAFYDFDGWKVSLNFSNIGDEEIVGLEIPTGQPIVYELADDLSVIRRYDLSA